MQGSALRPGALGALVRLLLALAALGGTTAEARTVALAGPVGGVDIDAAVADLADDHVALVGTPGAIGAPAAEWAAVVADARDANLNMSVVVLGTAPDGATPTAVADAVLGQAKGTILVLCPATPDGHTVGLSSNEVGNAEVDSVVTDLD